MTLAEFIIANAERIATEWAEFARSYFPATSVKQRLDHIEGMIMEIASDIAMPQNDQQRSAKSKGISDADMDAESAANAHGTDRADTGYTPVQMVSEFRALRASVLRLWAESGVGWNRDSIEEITRFNEAIDQLLAESLAKYTQNMDRSKDLFIGVLGHDLRNPLGAIMMSTTNILRREGPDGPHARAASRILDSGNRMASMVRDLLDFTRSRLGTGIPIVKSQMDLQTVCRQAIDEFLAFHPEFEVRFEATGDLQGQWDSERMTQVVSNLVGNAYQHGEKGAPVEVGLRADRDAAILTVRNSGAPIAAAHLKHIFSPFRQLDAARSRSQHFGSLGLGLYIVDAIVSAHQGTVSVESEEAGTTFTVRVPRVAAV